jgi:hypothetical protein
MHRHGKIFSVICLHNLCLCLVQPPLGMATEAKIARYSCTISSLCHCIWLVNNLKIPILVCIHVSRVFVFVPAGYFRRPILAVVKTGKFAHFQFLTTNIFLCSNVFNFVPPGSCTFIIIIINFIDDDVGQEAH